MKSMFVITALMTAMTFSIPAWSAEASASVKTLDVDARRHCVDLSTSSVGQATMPIATGWYRVTVRSNAFYHLNNLPIKKLSIYVTTDNQPRGWFWVVEENIPTFINVSGIGVDALRVHAYFTDILCYDNTGSARLVFRRLGP